MVRIALVAVVVVVACKKQEAPPPAPPPALKLIDAAIDAPVDAPIDAAVDAPVDAVLDAGERCKPNECYFEARKQCVVPTGQRGNAACGRHSNSDVCVVCRCAAPWTPIDTPSGPRAISELRTGDLVYSLDGEGVVVVPIERTNRVEVTGHRATELVLDDGSQLLISSEHPLADGRELGVLGAGDTIGPRRVVRARIVDYPFGATYDIRPATPTGVYFSNGIPLGSTLAP